VEAEGVQVNLVVFDRLERREDAREALVAAMPVELVVHRRHHAAAEGAHVHDVARVHHPRRIERAQQIAPRGRGHESP
jgi:hypothetical protein